MLRVSRWLLRGLLALSFRDCLVCSFSRLMNALFLSHPSTHSQSAYSYTIYILWYLIRSGVMLWTSLPNIMKPVENKQKIQITTVPSHNDWMNECQILDVFVTTVLCGISDIQMPVMQRAICSSRLNLKAGIPKVCETTHLWEWMHGPECFSVPFHCFLF